MARRRRHYDRIDPRSSPRLIPDRWRPLVPFSRPGDLPRSSARAMVRRVPVVRGVPVGRRDVKVGARSLRREVPPAHLRAQAVVSAVRSRICSDRQARREVLFARRFAGGGGVRRQYRWTERSNVRC